MSRTRCAPRLAVSHVAPPTAILLTSTLLLFVTSCGGKGSTEPDVRTIVLVSGNNQTGTVGQSLGSPIVVEVRRNGEPAEGVTVAFSVTGGGGTITPATATTGAAGRASATWTLGTTAGNNAATASSTGFQGSPITFSATGTSGPAAALVKVSGDAQSGTPGTALPQPIVARVTDAHGNPVQGAVVTWNVTGGGGSVDPISAASSANGQVSVTWTLGATGPNTLRATAAGQEAIFNAMADAPQPNCADIEVFGNGATLSGNLPTVRITGAVIVTGATTICGNLIIEGAGADLIINGQQVTVDGDLTLTTGVERLTLMQVADRLTVKGNATFNAGSTEGRLTAGELHLAGNFTAGGTSFTAFASTGTLVVLNGTSVQTVSFLFPHPANQRFQDLRITNTTGVEFVRPAVATGSLQVTAGAVVQVGADDTLFVSGAVTAAAGSSMSGNALAVGGALSVAGSYAIAHTLFTGTNQDIPGGLPYQHLVVRGTARLAANAAAAGNLTLHTFPGSIPGTSGELTLNGRQLTVDGNLAMSTGAERLVMTNAADRLTIKGNATFTGHHHEGLLSAGELHVAGNFTAGGTSFTAFASTGTLVVLNGTSVQTVTFMFPAAASQRFHTLRITNAAGVELGSNVQVNQNLDLVRRLVVPNGRTMTVAGTLFLRSTATLVNNGTMTVNACTKEAGHTITGTDPCP